MDNTLLDNNRFVTYFGTRLEQAFSAADHFAMLQMAHIGIDGIAGLLQMPANTAIDSPPNMSIGHISGPLSYELSHFLSSHRRAPHP